MPTLPTNPHYIGDSGHVDDHNTIVTALASAAYLSGGNIVNQTGSSTYRFGKVLQILQTTSTATWTNSTTTYSNTGLTGTITPAATTSKILVVAGLVGYAKSSGNVNNGLRWKLQRGTSTDLVNSGEFTAPVGYTATALTMFFPTISIYYLDSPATTSATSYRVQAANNTASAEVSKNAGTDVMLLIEVGA